MTEEQIIQKSIIQFLTINGFQVIRINNAPIPRFDKNRRLIGFQPVQTKGVPDLYVISEKRKQAAWIEVKTPKEKAYIIKHWGKLLSGDCVKSRAHTRDQVQLITKMENSGVTAFFACSVDDVRERLRL